MFKVHKHLKCKRQLIGKTIENVELVNGLIEYRRAFVPEVRIADG